MAKPQKNRILKMKRSRWILLVCLAVLPLLAAKRGVPPIQNGLPGDPVAGARIYQNWIIALDVRPPEGDQPLWGEQDSNERSGDVTWRCKECHGWDYKGSEGAFGPSSIRYTGFPSLEGSVGSSQEEVLAWLDGSNNPQHNFLEITNANALNDVAVFLRTMQADLALVIDYETGEALGNENSGAELYASACEECHGSTGRRINFSAAGSPLYIGDLASVDPWKSAHAIRFGSVLGDMPGSEELGWSLGKVADVIAYSQTLPRGNPNFAIFQEVPDEVIARQGETDPMLWLAAAILSVIAGGLVWGELRKR